jgi:hypothetical protein
MKQGHTKHCVSEMLDGQMMHKDANGQFSYLKYPYCGKMGGYNLGWPEQGTWSLSGAVGYNCAERSIRIS